MSGWVKLGETHINTDNINRIEDEGGSLTLWFIGDDKYPYIVHFSEDTQKAKLLDQIKQGKEQ